MRRHPGTFVAGLLFIGIGIAYILQGLDVWQVRPGRLWPIALIVIGAVVLFAGRVNGDEDVDRREPYDSNGGDAQPS